MMIFGIEIKVSSEKKIKKFRLVFLVLTFLVLLLFAAYQFWTNPFFGKTFVDEGEDFSVKYPRSWYGPIYPDSTPIVDKAKHGVRTKYFIAAKYEIGESAESLDYFRLLKSLNTGQVLERRDEPDGEPLSYLLKIKEIEVDGYYGHLAGFVTADTSFHPDPYQIQVAVEKNGALWVFTWSDVVTHFNGENEGSFISSDSQAQFEKIISTVKLLD